MSEYTILYTAIGSFSGLVISSLFYGLCGRSGKWKRRFVASAIMAATVNIASAVMGLWRWEFMLTYPILAASYSLGYDGGGANETVLWIRIAKRTLCAAVITSAGLIFCWKLGGNAWEIYSLQVILGVCTIFIGVSNPVAAASEEVLISMMFNLGLCMYPFIKL